MHVEDETLLLEIGDKIKEFYSPNSDLADNLLAGVQVNSVRSVPKSLKKFTCFSIIPIKISTRALSNKLP